MRRNRKTALLELYGDNVARIDNLKRMAKADTRTIVVAQALQLYEYMLERHQDGDRFFVGPENGDIEEIKIFGVKAE